MKCKGKEGEGGGEFPGLGCDWKAHCHEALFQEDK